MTRATHDPDARRPRGPEDSWVDGPGNRYVLFLQGCNFACTACHNPHTIPLATPRARMTPPTMSG